MKYDVEAFCADLKTLITARLNTKLLEISAEKNDGMVLAPLDNAAYFFQELNGRSANYDPYLLYSVEDMPSVGIGPATAVEPVVHVILVLADYGQDSEGVAKRLFRYQRALQEIFEEHWTSMQNGIKLSVTSMMPVSFSLKDAENSYRAIGVAVTGRIA